MEKLVDVGDRRLRMLCLGEGGPTVVLEAGMGQTLETWRAVQPALAAATRVVSYDRAGVGRSDPAPRPRSLRDMVADLRALLTHARVPAPYVLVGHSLGGLVVRVFADRFPADVAGMVLVDAPHPAYPQRALALLPPESAGECAEVAESRRFFAEVVQGADRPDDNPEGFGWGTGLAQALATGRLGDRPLVVLSAGKHDGFAADFPADLAASISALVRDCQRDLVGLSSRGEHVVAQSSGHMIQLDRPDVVVAAVGAVVRAARSAG